MADRLFSIPVPVFFENISYTSLFSKGKWALVPIQIMTQSDICIRRWKKAARANWYIEKMEEINSAINNPKRIENYRELIPNNKIFT